MRTFRKDSFDYSSVLDLVVDMQPVDIDERAGQLKTSAKRRSSILRKPPDSFCAICLENVSFLPHINCLECKRTEVSVCIPCFQMGAESGEHRRGHNYTVIYRCGPPVFESASNEGPQWGLLEEQRLLGLIRAYKVEDWPKIALAEFGRVRTVEDSMNHFNRCFLNGVIGEIVLEGVDRPPIHAFGLSEPEIYTGEFFRPISVDVVKSQIKESLEKLPNANHLIHAVEYNETPAIRPVKLSDDLIDERFENMICEFSHIHVEHNNVVPQIKPFNYPRCFIQERLTQLHKSPRAHNRSFSTGKGSKQKFALNLFEEEDRDDDSHPFPKTPFDNNLEAEDLTPLSGSPVNRYTLRDKKQRSSLMSNGISHTNFEEMSISPPSSPQTPRHRDKREDMDGDGDNPYASKDRGIKRHRDTLSYSPPKNRKHSIVRTKRRKIVFDHKRRMLKAKRKMMPKLTASGSKSSLQSNSGSRRVAKKHSQRQLESVYFSKEELLALRLTHPTLIFTGQGAPLLTKQQIKKFDSDDLNLIAYNPKRDDFEHEYRNAAEHFISKIFLNGESLVTSELEQFKNAIRVARVHRYNRILERRTANHAIIREHQLLNEFFSIVKTNVNERGKYNLLAADSFPSRKRAEEVRPLLSKVVRVLPSAELNNLAEDIAEIESLMVRIRMLRGFQTAGITEIKGRIKTEIAITFRNRKRKARKTDNGELRRANLRWNRIKKWSKRINENIE